MEDVLSPVQLRVLRAECDAVTRARGSGGTREPRRRRERASRGKGGGGGGGGGGGRAAFERVPGVALPRFRVYSGGSRVLRVLPRARPANGGVQVRSLRGDARGGGCDVGTGRAPRRAGARAPGGLGAIRGRTRKEGRERTAGNGDGRRRVPVQRPVHRQAPSSAAARFTWHRDSQWCDEAAGSPSRKTQNSKLEAPKRRERRSPISNASFQRVPYARPLRQPVDRAGRRRRDERVRAGPAVPRRARVRNPRKKRVATSGRAVPRWRAPPRL